jgi:hypothetical protein
MDQIMKYTNLAKKLRQERVKPELILLIATHFVGDEEFDRDTFLREATSQDMDFECTYCKQRRCVVHVTDGVTPRGCIIDGTAEWSRI